MRMRILIVLAAAAAASVAATAALGAGRAAPTATYPDATGDSGSAPDLVQAVVADDGAGSLRFRITLGSVADLADSTVVVLLDTDRDASTGSGGADYAVWGSSEGLAVGRWGPDGWGDFEHGPTEPDLDDGVLSFTLRSADIGNPTGFGFVVGSVRGEDVDVLPDDESYLAYPARPRIERIVYPATLLFPKAGKVLRATGVQVVLADGSPQAEITTSCTLAYRKRALPALAGGCAWRVPKTLKHRTLTLTLRFSSGGEVLLTRSLQVAVG